MIHELSILVRTRFCNITQTPGHKPCGVVYPVTRDPEATPTLGWWPRLTQSVKWQAGAIVPVPYCKNPLNKLPRAEYGALAAWDAIPESVKCWST
jgi:hypothetical protein